MEEVTGIRRLLRSQVAPGDPCSTWQCALEKCAAGLQMASATTVDSKTQECHAALLRIRALQDQCEKPEENKKLANLEARARRRLRDATRRARLISGKIETESKRRVPVALLDKRGNAEQDQTKWPDIVHAHFSELFESNAEEVETEKLEFLNRLEAAAACGRLDGHPRRWTLTVEDVEHQWRQLKAGVAPGSDGVPAELMAILETSDIEMLHGAFLQRLLGLDGHRCLLDAWRCYPLFGIPKKGDTRSLSRWRGLCVSATLLKLYEGVLWFCLDQLIPQPPLQLLAFRRHRQPMDVSEGIRWLAAKADEWKVPLIIASMDVSHAFDDMPHTLIAQSLLADGAGEELTSAWLREHMDLAVLPTAAGVTCSAVRQTKGGRQGGARTPHAWNHAFGVAFARAKLLWRDMPPAMRWAGELEDMAVLAWADNVFVLADSCESAERRIHALVEQCDRFHMLWGSDSLEFLANDAARSGSATPLSLALPDGRTFEEKEKLQVLGVAIDRRGDNRVAREARMAEGLRLWWAHRAMLSSLRLPLRWRLRRFFAVVGQSMLHGAGGWTVTKATCMAIQAREMHHLREIVGVVRGDDEPWAVWLQRSAKTCNRARIDAREKSLVHAYLLAVHGWLGHVARAGQEARWTPAGLALEWRNLPWWRTAMALQPRAERRGAGFGDARHASRCAWQDSVELSLEKFHEPVQWRDAARDRAAWSCSAFAFVRHHVEQWRLPRLPPV